MIVFIQLYRACRSSMVISFLPHRVYHAPASFAPVVPLRQDIAGLQEPCPIAKPFHQGFDRSAFRSEVKLVMNFARFTEQYQIRAYRTHVDSEAILLRKPFSRPPFLLGWRLPPERFLFPAYSKGLGTSNVSGLSVISSTISLRIGKSLSFWMAGNTALATISGIQPIGRSGSPVSLAPCLAASRCNHVRAHRYNKANNVASLCADRSSSALGLHDRVAATSSVIWRFTQTPRSMSMSDIQV